MLEGCWDEVLGGDVRKGVFRKGAPPLPNENFGHVVRVDVSGTCIRYWNV